jgi:hypothetical protein
MQLLISDPRHAKLAQTQSLFLLFKEQPIHQQLSHTRTINLVQSLCKVFFVNVGDYLLAFLMHMPLINHHLFKEARICFILLWI